MADALRTVLATPAHAEALAASMREADVEEARACGFTRREALLSSMHASEVTHAVLFRDEVLALYGVVPVPSHAHRALVWALTGRAVDKHRVAFHRESKRVLRALAAACPDGLYNYVDERHTQALRWVRRLGFYVLPVVPYGPHRMPFHPVVYVPEVTHG